MTGAAEPALRAACCRVWSHPVTRMLVGGALHPGGSNATAALVDALALAPGTVVIDLGCGPGAALGVMSARGLAPIGFDLAPEAVSEARALAPAAVADAVRIPVRAGAAGAVIAECVASLCEPKDALASEMARIVAPGGRVGLSDVTVSGPLPSSLSGAAAWIACLGGALTRPGYVALLKSAGFEGVSAAALDDALHDLLVQVKRRVALWDLGVALGAVDAHAAGMAGVNTEDVVGVLDDAIAAVERGVIGYGMFCGSRP